MPALKPAYLIHGEDHGAIAERRARLRALSEAQGGADSVELLEGDSASAQGAASALAAMTLALGRRVIVVEGAERFKEGEVQEHLVPALRSMPPDTTIAFFAREDTRYKAPPALHEAVRSAGGQVLAEGAVKPWELAGWVREQGARLGLSLDPQSAKALIAQVGERQQRLLRELEKLVLQLGGEEEGSSSPIAVSAEQIEERASRSTVWKTFSFADALVGGEREQAVRLYLRLRAQEERITGLLYLMASRLRDAEGVAVRLAAGESPAQVKRSLRMPPKAAERFIADVQRTDPERLRSALCRVADLELDTRGGPALTMARTPLCSLQEDTLALRAILAIASR